ncbi:hypothetical protein GDO86_011634 [Hymenochirus boettgeri]|uniref:MARVEL domain-containing protein n=1 Tax=Hymenochirus boettgeri TaxID=247094 RepID=A0A8T2JH10_9PIPI|nr:hypothetical protein GDO86_011634 [Hymenochirus boettgeri]
MADPAVYGHTTEPNRADKQPCCSHRELGLPRLVIKCLQLLLSFVAFLCEEIIEQCENCGGLYFFEFVSCSAFLLVILLLFVYLTSLNKKVNNENLKFIDFIITCGIVAFFFISSIVFSVTKDKDSPLSDASVAFGFLATFAFLAELIYLFKTDNTPCAKKLNANGATIPSEGEPLNIPVQAQDTVPV